MLFRSRRGKLTKQRHEINQSSKIVTLADGRKQAIDAPALACRWNLEPDIRLALTTAIAKSGPRCIRQPPATYDMTLAYVLVGKPAATPYHLRGRLFPGHACVQVQDAARPE